MSKERRGRGLRQGARRASASSRSWRSVSTPSDPAWPHFGRPCTGTRIGCRCPSAGELHFATPGPVSSVADRGGQPLNFGAREFHRSPVAQLVEQAAVNRLVAGSSPARGAIQPFFATRARRELPWACLCRCARRARSAGPRALVVVAAARARRAPLGRGRSLGSLRASGALRGVVGAFLCALWRKG